MKKITSYDPEKTDILHLIERFQNPSLIAALEAWEGSKEQDDFFIAACNKQGSGILRILRAQGFRCSPAPLELAIKRKSWKIAAAMLPCLAKPLPRLAMSYHEPLPHPLMGLIYEGQFELAKTAFGVMSGDPAEQATLCLTGLAFKKRRAHKGEEMVGWLVERGANPNHVEPYMGCALKGSLDLGNMAFACALIKAGANLSVMRNPSEQLAVGLYRGREWDTDHGYPSIGRISEDAWSLVDLAMKQGVGLPPLKNGVFEMFGHSSDRLEDDDVEKVEAKRAAFALSQSTPEVPRATSRPRI